MRMSAVLLCRHAQSPGVDTTSGLTATGASQAAELALFIQQSTGTDIAASGLPPVTRVCASTFVRAVDTAAPLAAALHLTVEQRSDLSEWDLPRLDGDGWEEQMHALLDGSSTTTDVPSEDRPGAVARIAFAVADGLAGKGTAVLVSHGKLLALWLGEQLGVPPSRLWVHLENVCALVVRPPVASDTGPIISMLRGSPELGALVRAGAAQPQRLFAVEHASLRDEDAAFAFEVEYFRGTAGGEESVAEMRAAWSAPDSWPRREFRARCDEGRVLVVKTSDALPPVGFLRWNRCGSEECACGGTAACVGHVFVASSWRRQGVAELLLTTFCEEAAIAGFRQSCLAVEPWNVGARALYAKHGYRPSCDKARSAAVCGASLASQGGSDLPSSETLVRALSPPDLAQHDSVL